MAKGNIKENLGKVARIENDELIIADRVAIDKERAAEIGIGTAAVAIVAISAARRSKIDPDNPPSYVATAAGNAGLVAVGAGAAVACLYLEGKREQRLGQTRNPNAAYPSGDNDVIDISPSGDFDIAPDVPNPEC